MLSGGQPGNQNAAKSKPWQNALRRALARKAGEVDLGLDGIADQVVADAYAGDKDAWKEIAERIDGKVAQSITGPDDGPLIVEVIRIANPDSV